MKVVYYLFVLFNTTPIISNNAPEQNHTELPNLSNGSSREENKFPQKCLVNEEISRIPPDVISRHASLLRYLAYNGNFCSKLSMENRSQVLCSFYECLVDEYMSSNAEYPHTRCLELYPNDKTVRSSVKFYQDLSIVKQEYPNVDVKLYYGSLIEVTGKFFCTMKIRSCFIDKKSQYIYSFFKHKSTLIQHWYEQFYRATVKVTPNSFINSQLLKKDEAVSVSLDFKAIIATFITFIIAAMLGIVNIVVVKEVLNEDKDACAKHFHLYETILDLIQSFISFITRLNIDEYLVLLWSDLCYTPRFHYSQSNRPQVGRLLAWGLLLSNQHIYCWLAKDRYQAMKYPLEYNSRGMEHAKKAKKKVYMITIAGILFSVLEIIVHQLFLLQALEKNHYCTVAGKIYNYDIYIIAEHLIELINWLSIAAVVGFQFYYSVSALIAWYKFNKNILNESTCERIREDSESELAKTKQRFTLLVGTCIMNFICVTPWLVQGFLKQYMWFCVSAQIYRCLNLGDQVKDALTKMCLATSTRNYWQRKFRSVWPVFIVVNCFSVIVHICLTKTYRSALVRVCKSFIPKKQAKVHVLPRKHMVTKTNEAQIAE